MLQQGHIKIHARWVVQGVPAYITEGESLRRGKSLGIIQQWSECKRRLISWQIGGPSVLRGIRIGACAGSIRYSGVVENRNASLWAAPINHREGRSGLVGGHSGKFPLLQKILG